MFDGADRGPGAASALAPAPPRLVQALAAGTLVELILLGSGRLVQFGPLTARMALFGSGLVFALGTVAYRRRIDREVGGLVLAFLLVTVLGAVVGLLSGAPISNVAEDVKPLAFFVSLAFFSLAVRSTADVARVAGIVRACSMVLALGYLALLAAIVAGLVPFAPLYTALSESGEFFFRGESGFFYKGFVYLGVGIFFFAFRRGLASRVAALVLFAALAATLTRGLLLATGVVLALATILRQRNALYAAFAATGLALAGVAAWSAAAVLFGDRGASDAMRFNDVRNVIDGTTWWSVVIGHGLGTSIGVRDRIEATYLELLYKQGLVGLGFWLAVFALTARDYWRARLAGRRELADPFFLGSTFIFLESATNPLLTNPIGMSLVVVSMVALRVLARPAAPNEPRSASA